MTTGEFAMEILVYAFLVNFILAFVFAQKIKQRMGIVWAIISSAISIFCAVGLPVLVGSNNLEVLEVGYLVGGLLGMVISLLIIATLPKPKVT